MRICVTGYLGRLGSELVLAGCDPLDCDITNTGSIQQALYNKAYDVLINCAALTNVDAAEDEKEYENFIKVNTRGIANLRDAFVKRIIHISTDYVFSGVTGPYSENSRMENPVNKYGYSKLGGEAVMIASGYDGDTIVRTTGLFGSHSVKNDLVEYVTKEVGAGNPVLMNRSLYGNQTYVPFLAEQLIQLSEMSKPPRLLHLASSNIMNRYEFALKICDVFGLNKKYVAQVDKVQGWVAKRPTNGGLNTALSVKKYGFTAYTVEDGLQEMLK